MSWQNVYDSADAQAWINTGTDDMIRLEDIHDRYGWEEADQYRVETYHKNGETKAHRSVLGTADDLSEIEAVLEAQGISPDLAAMESGKQPVYAAKP